MIVDGIAPSKLLNILLLEQTLAIFVVRPFISPNITILSPTHHFWPFVPVATQKPETTTHAPSVHLFKHQPSERLPTHHFWPLVPVTTHSPETTTTHSPTVHLFKHRGSEKLPTHHFWPLIPVSNHAPKTTTTHKARTHHSKKHHEHERLPSHNFWPLIPVQNPKEETKGHRSWTTTTTTNKPLARLPSHNFWPWIPVQIPEDVKKNISKTYDVIPAHNFWPFIPIATESTKKPITTPRPPRPWPPSQNRYNYGEVLYKSIMFFEVQRSGWLPEDRKIEWRGHSATYDEGDFGEDLSGGWYDSGDYIKFGLPMATSTSLLLWGLVEFSDAYKSQGLLDDMRDCVKWPLDYFIKAHPEKFVFYGQVGDPYIDHTYWGRPEDMDMERPAYRLTPDSPGSDLIGETAAAMAAGYVAFKHVEPHYAKKLLEHAQELFEFAENFRGGYSHSIENADEFYASFTDEDELAWAAAWLYRATNNKFYLKRAEHWFHRMSECWAQSWADKSCGVPVLLYKLTKDRKYKAATEKMFDHWLPGGTLHYTPKGLAFRSEWGTLRYTANMAFISLVAADLGIETNKYRLWARRQIHYMLGDAGRSYVIGFGHDPPTRPHHASSSCNPPPEPCDWSDYTKDEPNAHILYGALVGGPGPYDDYEDDRDDYIHNEVGCDYNGGFQSAVAALKYVELRMM